MNIRKWLKTAAIFLTLLGLCAGCAGREPAAEGTPALTGYSGSVTLFCSMQEEQIQAIKAGFEQKYPDITMNYFFAGTSKVLTKLATEMQSGEITADLVWTGAPSDYRKLKEDRCLSPYISPQAININEAFVDEHHYYIGGRLMSAVIAYNTELVSEDEAPRNWEDLLDPKWKGKIVMTDPGSSGSTKYFVGALMNAPGYGEAYFEQLKENGCMLESNSTATHLQIADGTYAVGICLDYIVSNLQQDGEPISFHVPERDLVPVYSPMGLVAGCPNERNGRLLYDYILSKEGQQILTDHHLHSIRDDVGDAGISIRTILDTRLPVDDQVISDTTEAVMDRFDRIFFQE
jgi:iron(III) transport system substrate-binding protein